MKVLKLIEFIAQLLVLIGALNWGMVGVFQLDPVHALFGKYSKIIYTFVGVSALFLIVMRLI